MTKRYLVTTAINQAPVSKPFWSSLLTAAKHLKAELIVVGALYRNPTVRGEKGDPDVYADEVAPYLTRARRVLGPNLTLFADIPVQPTAGNPLSGLEVFAKNTSAIVGHVKRAMTVVPTTRHPRAMWTTGACTVPSYSASRAGARAAAHHVLGAVIVEVVGKRFFVRNVTSAKDGSFTDLDMRYSGKGAKRAPAPLSIVAGDYHVGQDDPPAVAALRAMVADLKPGHLFLHDMLDFKTQSHHRQDKKSRFESRNVTVADELRLNAATLADISDWGSGQVVVVASNHDSHFQQWLSDEEPSPQDAELYHAMWAHLYATHRETGSWANPYEAAMQWCDVPEAVRFLRRGESFRLGGVEHGFHGDKGSSGARGSIRNFARLGCRVTIGHSHTPGILDGVVQVGVTGRLDMDYTAGAPSSWMHAHAVLHQDGKRQLVITQGARYRG